MTNSFRISQAIQRNVSTIRPNGRNSTTGKPGIISGGGGGGSITEIPSWASALSPVLFHSGSALVPSGWSSNGNTNISIQTDATAPRTPSSVLRVNYPIGFAGGTEPVTLFSGNANDSNRLFYSFWIRYNSTFDGHPSQVNKQTFVFTSAGGNWFYTAARFSGNASTMYFDILTQGMTPGDNWITEQAGGNQLTVNKNDWHRVSVEIDRSGGAGSSILRLWVNGIQVGQLTNCTFPGNMNEFQIAPTWGGTGGSVSTTSFFDLDQLEVYRTL